MMWGEVEWYEVSQKVSGFFNKFYILKEHLVFTLSFT